MRKTGGALLAVILAASVGLGACGDDDNDDTGTAGQTPTSASNTLAPNDSRPVVGVTTSVARPSTTGQ